MPEAKLNLYFNPIKPTLYMSKSSIFTIGGVNRKYIKATLSNDATNNSAIVKYDDTNYFPESFIFYCVDVANNSYMFVIETRKDRAISSENCLFLCFPVTLNHNAETSTLSEYLKAISVDTPKSIKLELSEVMKNDANGYFTGFDVNYVYVSNNSITVSADTALLSGLTNKLNLDNLYSGINSTKTDKSVNAILKQSELQTIMDCQAATGDDMADMENVNVNATISREQLMSNTVVMILMFAGIIFFIFSIFDNLMYSLFSIIDVLNKYNITVLKDEKG